MTKTFTILKGLTLGLLGAVALNATVAPDRAEAAQCGPREKVVEHITGKIKASRQALGLAGQSNMVELYVAKSGAWIMTVTNTDKATCVLAAGSSWETVPLKVAAGPAV
jgi:hypothetical protein